MRLPNFWLFIIPALIWGSTWFIIKFQLGNVDPLVSVVYRYWLAGIVMLIFCLIRRLNLKFTLHDHLFMAVQGFFLFGTNYWLVYEAEQHVTSGTVAVAFSVLIFMNAFFGLIFLKRPINRKVLVGALAGLSGTIFIFSNELIALEFSNKVLMGSALAILSVVLASFGNIASTRNSGNGIPVIQANSFGMLYGGILMNLIAWGLGRPFTFDYSATYIYSLVYLTIFGSIIAFAAYLTLISRIGPDKAAYTLVVIPIIAIAISMIFENYQLTIFSGLGIVLILVGNILALKK